jgi:hypothetical protein
LKLQKYLELKVKKHTKMAITNCQKIFWRLL